MPISQPPIGIIRTLPAFYGDPSHEACQNYRAAIERMAHDEEAHWFVLLPSKPRHANLLHIYILINGLIDCRFTFAGLRETDGDMKLWDDSEVEGKRLWAICAGPAEKAPHEIYRPGFRGFRYTFEPFW